jgi:hypothetical protein
MGGTLYTFLTNKITTSMKTIQIYPMNKFLEIYLLNTQDTHEPHIRIPERKESRFGQSVGFPEMERRIFVTSFHFYPVVSHESELSLST